MWKQIGQLKENGKKVFISKLSTKITQQYLLTLQWLPNQGTLTVSPNLLRLVQVYRIRSYLVPQV